MLSVSILLLTSCTDGGKKFEGTWNSGQGQELKIERTGDAYSITQTSTYAANPGFDNSTYKESHKSMVTFKNGNLVEGDIVIAAYADGKIIYKNVEYTRAEDIAKNAEAMALSIPGNWKTTTGQIITISREGNLFDVKANIGCAPISFKSPLVGLNISGKWDCSCDSPPGSVICQETLTSIDKDHLRIVGAFFENGETLIKQ